MDNKDLQWTGERMETHIFDSSTLEHLHRYGLCFEYTKNKTVLDIASGEGYGSNLLSYYATKVTGVDISSETIDKARKKYTKENLEFLNGSATNIPLPSDSVDVVISFETIEHHDEHEKMMLEVKRVLKTDGLLIISTPDKLNYTDIPNTVNPFHVKELYVNEFEGLLKSHFSNVSLCNQKIVYGSLIHPTNFETFNYFTGNYSQIVSTKNIEPLYVIGFASDNSFNSPPISIFDGSSALENIFKKIADDISIKYQESATFKIGRILTSPFKFIKSLVKR